MTKREKRKLLYVIIKLIVAITFVYVTIAISTNAVVTNEVALGQLNGGNEAYLAQEIYYKYKAIASYIGAVIIIWAAMPLFKIIYKQITKKLKEKNK